MAELSSLRNIGKNIEKKLKSININTVEELIQVGSKEAFLRLKVAYPNTCLVYLYTLQGAIDDIDYNQLPEATKIDLKEFVDGID